MTTPSNLRRLRNLERTLYILAYDVEDDRQRRKIARIAEGNGHRIQKSVFAAHLAKSEAEILMNRMSALMNSPKDALFIAPTKADAIMLSKPDTRIHSPRIVVA